MGRAFHEHLVSRTGMETKAQLIRHHPGGHEQGRVFSQQSSRLGFQGIDRWIFPIHVIAYLGLSHGFPHARSRLGDGIASQVNHRRPSTERCKYVQRPFFILRQSLDGNKKPDFRQNPLNLLGGNGACTKDGRLTHHAQQGGRPISRTRSGIQNQIDVMTQ